jgi:hypothetical protein
MRYRDAAGLAIFALAIALDPACAKPPSALSANPSVAEDATAIPDSDAGSQLGYYDPGGYAILANQGVSPGNFTGFHTWRWRDGWRHLAVIGSPYAYSNMAYDPDLGLTVVIGALLSPKGAWLAERGKNWTLGWNGSEWVDLHAASPNDSSAQYLAFDEKRHRLMLTTADSNAGSTWAFEGGAWIKLSSGGPKEHFGSGFAYDPRSGNTLMFGGECSGGFCHRVDMWSWDGASWTQLHPKNVPTDGPGLLAFYPATQQMIYLARDRTTWNWDGGNWSQLRIEGPSIGGNAGLVYDRTRDQLFLWRGTSCYGRGSWTSVFKSGVWTFLPASSTSNPPSFIGQASGERLGNC